jgi:hypothetical protein
MIRSLFQFGKNGHAAPDENDDSHDEHEEKILDALEWGETDSAETLEERKEALERELAHSGS